MDKFELICNLIVAILGIVPTVVSLVLLIKNIIVNKNWSLVTKIAQTAMSSVEEYSAAHPGMTGEDKLNMAIEAVKAGCGAAGIKVDDILIKKIVDYIGDLCSWSKTVNTK